MCSTLAWDGLASQATITRFTWPSSCHSTMMHWKSTQGHFDTHMHSILTMVMLEAPLRWHVIVHAYHLSILHCKPMISSASIQQATKHIRKPLQYERVDTYSMYVRMQVRIRFQTYTFTVNTAHILPTIEFVLTCVHKTNYNTFMEELWRVSVTALQALRHYFISMAIVRL